LGLSSWTKSRVFLVGRKGTFTAPIKEGVEIGDVFKRHSWMVVVVVAGDGRE